jgi:hypothetical protein
MSLAHALGKTRRELLNGLDSYELELWVAYLNEIKKMPEKTKQKQDVSGTLKSLMVSKSKGKRRHA